MSLACQMICPSAIASLHYQRGTSRCSPNSFVLISWICGRSRFNQPQSDWSAICPVRISKALSVTTTRPQHLLSERITTATPPPTPSIPRASGLRCCSDSSAGPPAAPSVSTASMPPAHSPLPHRGQQRLSSSLTTSRSRSRVCQLPWCLSRMSVASELARASGVDQWQAENMHTKSCSPLGPS